MGHLEFDGVEFYYTAHRTADERFLCIFRDLFQHSIKYNLGLRHHTVVILEDIRYDTGRCSQLGMMREFVLLELLYPDHSIKIRYTRSLDKEVRGIGRPHDTGDLVDIDLGWHI